MQLSSSRIGVVKPKDQHVLIFLRPRIMRDSTAHAPDSKTLGSALASGVAVPLFPAAAFCHAGMARSRFGTVTPGAGAAEPVVDSGFGVVEPLDPEGLSDDICCPFVVTGA